MKRIAVIGAGISGLTAARALSREHQVVLFEAEAQVGGHTRTVAVHDGERQLQVDVGFIVFNDRTYPHFNQLLDELGVARQPTRMGFAVRCERTGLEYSGDGLGGLFAQRRNLFSPAHYRMIGDILRFNREAPALLAQGGSDIPLADYLDQGGYGQRFRDQYIVPMGGAIWSCSAAQMAAFPAKFFVRFFANHGLLSIRNRPQWYVVPGGSYRYVEKLLAGLSAELRTATPVQRLHRIDSGVQVDSSAGSERFDEVVLACHSDQALALLDDADADAQALLKDIPYQDNDVVLHTDTRLLPTNRRCWSSWNALIAPRQAAAVAPDAPQRVQLTYNMNILQGLQSRQTWCVTLNATDRIDPQTIIQRFNFSHPLFTPAGLAARDRLLDTINGRRQIWFCGAWCGNGFHEDGVVSALNVARGLLT